MRCNFALSAVIALLIVPNLGWARSDTDARISRLETIVANELNGKLLHEIETMQQEIRELRGKLEEQQNSVQVLDQKQNKLFLNLEARINSLTNSKPAAQANLSALPNSEAVAAEVKPEPVANVQTKLEDSQQQAIPAPSVKPTVQMPEVIFPGTDEKSLYEAANLLMRDKRYSEAIIEFKDLLWQFPEGTYAVHAYYWLGELYMMQWQQNKANKTFLNHAKEAFNTITNKYVGTEREGDAMLKLGLIEMDQDHLAVAKEVFQNVVKKFPNAACAKVAEGNIARIDRARIE